MELLSQSKKRGIYMSLMNEYIGKRLSSADLEKELQNLIKKYNSYTNSYLFVYNAGSLKPFPDIGINQDDYFIISNLLREAKSKKLDFYIETPGGSGESVEEIVRFLRQKFDNINFLTSGDAKSAGTILVLSGDNISMTRTASLGPIDAQIKMGRCVVSAYDYIEWVNKTKNEAIKNKALNPFDAIVVSQITPGELDSVYHAFEYAKEMVKKWLVEYKFKNWNCTETNKNPVTDKMKQDRAMKIADDLTDRSKWHLHGSPIKLDDLNKIGLIINDIDNDLKLADIVYRIQTVCKLIFSSCNAYKLFFSADHKIMKNGLSHNQVKQLAPPPGAGGKNNLKAVDAIELAVNCPKCNSSVKLFAKFKNNNNIDKDFRKKGIQPIPKNKKYRCSCGFEIDLIGIINQLEQQTGKKVIT